MTNAITPLPIRRRALAGIGAAALIAFAVPASAQTMTGSRHATQLSQPPVLGPQTLPEPLANIARSRALARNVVAASATATTLNDPYGITVDASGNVYITNLFGGVNIYNSQLKLTGTITSGVSFPAAVSVSFDGNIWVANNGGNNVTEYNPSLTQVGTITDATLASPTSMFIDADDTVWVLDAGGTLHSYLYDGTVLPTTHTGGTAVGPWGPNVTVWGVLDSSGVYGEVYENRAQAVQSGASLYNDYVGSSPYAGGEAQDQYAQEYVSDLLHDQIQIWARDGAYIVGQIATPAAPYGVAVDPALNRVYVVLTTLNQVYVYSTKSPYKLVGIIR